MEHIVKLARNHGFAAKGINLEPLAYSITEACHVSSIGRTRLYALIKEGRLKTRKIGKRTLIPASSLRDLIEGEA